MIFFICFLVEYSSSGSSLCFLLHVFVLSSAKMSDDDMVCFVAAATVMSYFLHERERTKKRARRYWIHPVIADREERGQFWVMYSDLRDHEDKFLDYTRMSIKSFDVLLGLLSCRLQRMDTYFVTVYPLWND
ncbi:hypothetical protein AB205_0019250 [Aquarana catesbeiana]|uniref:Protein ALP1-like n=1 Tax=Aquarana catesbeiana TaxID=8400 RepID=A0A2G9QCM6_AQUCT|nr:hypothetical protein AB205_0019250 [Aquarana catesbeiana]